MISNNVRVLGIDNLDINLCDNSAYEFSNELVAQLEILRDGFSTHAMSEYELFLKGQKLMLIEIIEYIKKVKP